MHLGIFAKTFNRSSLEAVLAAVAEHGFSTIQLNLSSAGLATLPAAIDGATIEWIGGCLDAYNLSVAAVSGTFNMAHPDTQRRRDGLRGLEIVAGSCAAWGTSLITLCTGTRDVEDMWRAHPENNSEAAWNDLVTTLERALSIADRHGVTLAFEPEQGNVVNSAAQAKRLLDKFPTPRLGVVLDPANLLAPSDLPSLREVIRDAIDLLGKNIVLAHAKDLTASGVTGAIPPGRGVMDFGYFFAQLQQAKFRGAIIAHGLEENAVDKARAFLQEQLKNVETDKPKSMSSGA